MTRRREASTRKAGADGTIGGMMARFEPRQISDRLDIWGVWDNDVNDWCQATPGKGPRWHSRADGARLAADRWNRAGYQI